MAFWSAQKIIERQISNRPLIVRGRYNESNVKSSSYELCVGRYICTTSSAQKNAKTIDLSENGGYIDIEPGQFAIITTEEAIDIGDDFMAFISMKTSKKMKGLVNVSGFHVDPGFKSYLKFGVFNAGPSSVSIERGEQLFQIFFSDLDRATTIPYREIAIDPKISNAWREGLKGDTLSTKDVVSRIDGLEKFKTVTLSVLAGSVVIISIMLGFFGVSNYYPSLKKIDSVEERVAKLESTKSYLDEIDRIRKELLQVKDKKDKVVQLKEKAVIQSDALISK